MYLCDDGSVLPSRLADHFGGKLHLGYQYIRSFVPTLEASIKKFKEENRRYLPRTLYETSPHFRSALNANFFCISCSSVPETGVVTIGIVTGIVLERTIGTVIGTETGEEVLMAAALGMATGAALEAAVGRGTDVGS
jgi:hypothetical protein